MECETLLTYLSDYIDRELTDDLIEEAKAHLATCHNCRVVLDSTQQMIFLYKKQGQHKIPAAQRQKLFSQLSEAFSKKGDANL